MRNHTYIRKINCLFDVSIVFMKLGAFCRMKSRTTTTAGWVKKSRFKLNAENACKPFEQHSNSLDPTKAYSKFSTYQGAQHVI